MLSQFYILISKNHVINGINTYKNPTKHLYGSPEQPQWVLNASNNTKTNNWTSVKTCQAMKSWDIQAGTGVHEGGWGSAIMVHFPPGDASGRRGRHFLYHGEMEGAINLAPILAAAGRSGPVGRLSEWRPCKAIRREGNICGRLARWGKHEAGQEAVQAVVLLPRVIKPVEWHD